ncbi:1-deoxy-D-xylulose 5-phosphate reductoisomerase (DXP reductoisomerase) [Candidatus Glomeribacter gigasporarum BEG34]|uniref:1-deoxy-D-xylulose 5-phosphate reductoisomerase n=1 Tax=Candidatus Glomeribacter gigasporarum BEG34 TaxID=1070319 RepID=G2J9V3_9BURK|nr:1-deoxy-D-xylulose-5-phosphate reductoisomerase [Candidatus Glomeribacter gigasporarum]CCD29550.1 1-deoxy-D-xylulose 5-phosphate reductoisomerase (DXP reductoisomerase) [Candidatus Glomeribacter gigasporarum BEG34]
MQQRLTILGSTGSIGVSALDVVARHPERFSVFALCAHRNLKRLAEQCLQFAPEYAVIGSAADAAQLKTRLARAGLRTQALCGEAALAALAADSGCDTVIAAIVGAAGLAPTLAAARAGKRLLLANKEALVMSGALLMDAVRRHHAILLPIDSEHNAIYQCLATHGKAEQIILTASGGPFLTRDAASLADVTPAEACAHPNWSMGRKVSVDSATMMNKALEVIEAHWLFNMPAHAIEVLIHPQSIVHSMVRYADGSMLAQMSYPDMRTPIAHALAWPQRIASGVAKLDLSSVAELNFERVDPVRFPALNLAFEALRQGGTASAALNAANEIAVDAFLRGRARFTEITAVIERVLERFEPGAAHTLEEIFTVDARARRLAQEVVSTLFP